MQWWAVIGWALLALAAAHQCPDGGRCQQGQTCCSSPADGYECCPLDQAECCGDHVHCCPADTVCDSSTSSCVNATASSPWVKRGPADQPGLSRSFRMIKTNMGEDDDNICPDHSRCPAEFSCLKALTRFSCCPLPQGVPCSDGRHCCPGGHRCSADGRSCIKEDVATTVVCKDGVSECPDDTSCCETPEGMWGCCPLPNAVCCSDKVHCCPAGNLCDLEHSKCLSLTTKRASPMWAKLPARTRAEWENQKEEVPAAAADEVRSEQVPPEREGSVSATSASNLVPCDESTACADDTTCCKTKDEGWACCPLPKAVCCADFEHCCPNGKQCNLAEQTCDDGLWSEPWVKKIAAVQRKDVQPKLVPCDESTACEDDTTCCKTKDQGWACCPLPKAVCCADFEHCCPNGKQCNLAEQTCDDGLWSEPWVKKIAAVQRKDVQPKLVPCDESTACEDDTTCCKTKDQGWACCPLPKAVCCADFEHCCPNGKQCNLAEQTCDDGLWSEPWVKKIAAVQRKDVQPKLVPCDESTACEDDTTCCKTKDQGWACCPLPKAVCCADFEHCCPNGKQCNLAEQTCDDGLWSEPWVKKIAAVQRKDVQPKLVPCDESTACEDDTTCCKTKDQGWACCPLPKAVCCADFEHCCPNGKQCNLAEQTCDDGLWSEPWVKKIAAVQRKDVQPKLVPCDESTACEDDTTCCKTKDQGWACCPLPKAVCCADFEHCCPNGKQCNLAEQTCDDGLWSEPWVKKIAAVQRKDVQPKLVPCDESTACEDDTTCCKTKDQGWACCPLPKAVCCADFEHCCPNGKQCNLAEQTCDDGLWSEPWVKKIAAVQRKDVQPKLVPCDESTACEDDTTCCKTKDQGWACCPLPKAVCCADFEHCCPNGKQCNLAEQTCDDGLRSEPWVKKIAAVQRKDVQPKLVPCDESTACPDDTTCCKTKDQGWGCCPLPKAVCCDDQETCCPSGSTCNLVTESCDSAFGSTPMRQKIPALTTKTPADDEDDSEEEEEEEEDEEDGENQESPDQKEDDGGVELGDQCNCPDYSTCCPMAGSQTMGCCPLPNAVCCGDSQHCCPRGYTCEFNTCIHNADFDWHMLFGWRNKRQTL